ncbi:DUF2344 domain-containing protein [Calidifontibacter sp. DB0510]|uniref:DUF2344 domain-containing protein n=1 Tax=Metallococcus carri TaxID=1656884 RepID=A0A967E8X1_9MICO|nr:DUF2344 domain-containing protein [Metallococcus carri]NOP36901.1 DUF2344 domain-containing protein [Calidifontibacter sp. DB2511S]
MQKLRVRYAKRGRLRFTSTRDFQRALERAVRRARLPVAFSAGFHPHPKISYANAAATGWASEAEYFEISLTERADPAQVAVALDEALPPGLDVLQVVEAEPGALADRLQASVWRVDLPGADVTGLRSALERLLAMDRAEVTRMTKSGARTFDVRAAIERAELTADPAGLDLVLHHTTPAVRPTDILTALTELCGWQADRTRSVTRLAQGPMRADGALDDPLTERG